jgi:uncharacterized protein YprB with RNaseH-like and TPR domain
VIPDAIRSRVLAGAGREAELARLRALLDRLATRPPASPRPALPLTPVETPHGVAWRRSEDVSPPPALARVMEATTAPGTVFLDTETTGLAGGTGTYVFLVGLATWTGTGLRVTQYFLGDLGAEAAFLAAVREAVRDAGLLVTYNGRTFDLPLLETRYLLARAPWWGEALPHRDLYPLARALWRARVADCRLATLEAALLGLDRGDDLPGSEMPRLYFRYLRTQDRRVLPRIFTHNRWDLLALAALAARADDLLGGPDPRHDPVEWLAAARWLERREPGRSTRFYEAALDATLPAPLRLRAAWRLGRLWRRAGRTPEALRLWTEVLTDPDAAPVGLLVDLAKLEEHHARDLRAALRLARLGLARAEQDGGDEGRPLLAEALAHRVHRLERRVARSRVLGGPNLR